MKRRYHQFSQTLSRLLHAENINNCVNELLTEILQETKSDRVYVFAYDKELTYQDCIYEVVSKPEYAEKDSLQKVPLVLTPWWHNQLLEDNPIMFERLDDMPEEAASEYQILISQGIKSILVEPLSVNGKVWGYIGIDYVENYWSPREDVIDILYDIAGAIGVNIRFNQIQKAEREERHLLAIAKREAEEANKMKSMFLANMSHEIRTPLNIILNFSELMVDSDFREEREEFYSVVKRNAEGLLYIINDLLDMSKIEAGVLNYSIAPVNLDKICNEIVDEMASKTQNNVKLSYQPGEEDFVLNTDQLRLKQVIVNLVSNACKFTFEGSITIASKRISPEMIEVSVTDTGIGISAEDMPKLFSRFMKLNSNITGNGLGLVISKNIIEHLGGKITIESQQGKGSVFRFTHPIA